MKSLPNLKKLAFVQIDNFLITKTWAHINCNIHLIFVTSSLFLYRLLDLLEFIILFEKSEELKSYRYL